MSEIEVTLKQLSALSQDTRLRAFKLLMEASNDGIKAGVLSETLDVAPNSLSAHLNILTSAGLITVQRQGRHMIYRPNLSAVNSMLSSLIETYCNGGPEVFRSLSK